MKKLFFCLFLYFSCISISYAQWSNRYPKVAGYGHHVYLEGFELPVLNAGPTDPAPGPARLSNKLAFAARGWLWVMDLDRKEAKRITFSDQVDSSPAWSPNGEQLVFVRDDSEDTGIYLFNTITNKESLLVDSDALELDPIFSPDGEYVYYASAENGPIDLWQINLATKDKRPITGDRQLERLPVPGNKGDYLFYLRKKGFSYDAIEKISLKDSAITILSEETFASQAAFSLAPDNRTLVYSWPNEDDYELRMLDVNRPVSSLLLTKSEGLPLKPKFSADGKWVYYTETAKNERSQIKRIPYIGGRPETVEVNSWDWGTQTGKITIRTSVDGRIAPVRMNVETAGGHPVVPENGIVHSEGQNGRVFFYSPGEITLEAPLGELTIKVVQGFSTPEAVTKVTLDASEKELPIALTTLWNYRANGWYAGDNHFHLNYGGTNQLDPEDIELDLKAENIDMAWPLLANLHNRFLEQDLWGLKNEHPPLIRFGQEVRSHLLGHVNLIGATELFWPWIWGPSYDVYGREDLLNAEPLTFIQQQSGLGGYVHPVVGIDPFAEENYARVPIALVADAVLGVVDLLEVACLWSNKVGTATLWHAFLNLGIPISLSAGSDVMNDYYRTMAIGSTRVFVKPEGPLTEASYLQALKAGRSFVTNGPQLEFTVADKEVGGVIRTEKKKVRWSLLVHSPVAYKKVEIFVNGEIIKTLNGSETAGSKAYKGVINVPEGGWITARVSEGKIQWPVMDDYLYAESSPIWFGAIGSTTPISQKAAAQELLEVLNRSEIALKRAYGENPIPKLLAYFAKARTKLAGFLEE